MRRPFRAPNIVLGLLCAMYFITYLDRANTGAAAALIKEQFHLTNTQLGLVFSGFAYTYLCCQLVGGLIADRWGAKRTLVICGLVWAGATVLTGLSMGMVSLLAARLILGLGEGATFPAATQAMRSWVSTEQRGFAQGITHSFSRLGSAVAPPVVALLAVAWGWRASFIIVGIASATWIAVWALYFKDDPRQHPGVTPEDLAKLPPPVEKPVVKIPLGLLVRRMAPVTLTYFCYGWALWLYLNWLPIFFKTNYHLDIQKSALLAGGAFFAGVIGDTMGGVISDALYKRTGNLTLSRLVVIVVGFVGALCSLFPILFIRDLDTVAVCLSAGFFFAELVVGPIWSIPMDVSPEHCGTAAGLMNIGAASAAIVSPVIAGYIIDITGNWYLPFLISMGVMAVGAACAFLMDLKSPAIA